MTHDRWEASKGLRIELKFDPIQRQKPRYDWLWNSSSTKDVEIRFLDPQLAPILVHKNLILETCPKFVNLLQVVSSNSNTAGGDDNGVGAMAQGQEPKPPSARSSRPGSPTPTTSPVIPPQYQRSGQETDLTSMDDSSDISPLNRSMTGSFVNISREPSVYSPSSDDLSMTGSDCSQGSPRHSEDALLEDSYADERRPLLLAGGDNGDLDSDRPQQGDKGLGRKERKKQRRRQQRRLACEQNTVAAASGTTSPTDVAQIKTEDDQQERKMEYFAQEQEAKRLAHQQEREKSPHSPLTHITLASKTPSLPALRQQQVQHLQLQQQSTTGNNSVSVSVSLRPEREIWHWPTQQRPELCTFIIRWIYFEELPTHSADSNYPLNVIDLFLNAFHCLDLPILFQSFLTTQLSLIENTPNPMSLWKSAELAQQGGMVNRFFRPAIVKTSAKNLRTIVWSREFGEVLGGVDPSGIFREALARQRSPLARE